MKVVGLSDAVDVVRSKGTTCALKKDGSVWCWGSNRYGNLGIGAYSYSGKQLTPSAVVGSTP